MQGTPWAKAPRLTVSLTTGVTPFSQPVRSTFRTVWSIEAVAYVVKSQVALRFGRGGSAWELNATSASLLSHYPYRFDADPSKRAE
jgi:hypothetical protein